MRVLKNLTFKTLLIIQHFISKVSGYVFFSIKNNSNGIYFVRTIFDYASFFASLTFSFYVLFYGENSLKVEIQSRLLMLGTGLLFSLSVVSVSITKIINMFWADKEFEAMKISLEIDTKVE